MSAFFDRAVMAGEVLTREIGGESAILDLKTRQYLGLDEVGTRMWHLLLDSDSVQAAYDTLLSEYDVEPRQLEQDIREVADKSLENKILSIVGTAK